MKVIIHRKPFSPLSQILFEQFEYVHIKMWHIVVQPIKYGITDAKSGTTHFDGTYLDIYICAYVNEI